MPLPAPVTRAILLWGVGDEAAAAVAVKVCLQQTNERVRQPGSSASRTCRPARATNQWAAMLMAETALYLHPRDSRGKSAPGVTRGGNTSPPSRRFALSCAFAAKWARPHLCHTTAARTAPRCHGPDRPSSHPDNWPESTWPRRTKSSANNTFDHHT
jgi:hypothetical protein